MQSPQDILHIIGIGIGATAVMDAWLIFLRRRGIKTLNFAFIGRWAGHMVHGRFAHPAIADAAPVKGELAWGWLLHYATGIAFAALLVAIAGPHPRLLPALAVGICTVVIPLLVMQPCMGSGFAASKTPTPLKNCLRSLTNHTVFGLGLYLSAALLAWLAQ